MGHQLCWPPPQPSLWASVSSSVKWEGTVCKVPPGVSNTIWSICLALERDGGHSWSGRARHFASSQMVGLSVPLWAPLYPHPLLPAVPELRGEGRSQSCNGVAGDQPLGGETAPPPLPRGPRKIILQRSYPISDHSSQIGFLDLPNTQVTAWSGSGYHFLWHPLCKSSWALSP